MQRTMSDPQEIRRFALAGKATLTLKSKKTDRHFTYKFERPEKTAGKRFVKILTDGDKYVYLGMLDVTDKRFDLTRASKLKDDSLAVQAVRFFCNRVLLSEELPETLEVRHNGRCGRCNRELTHPESIDRGIGPECWQKVGGGE